LSVPLLAIAPQIAWRAELLRQEPYESLGLARADVLVPRTTAEDTRGVIDFVHRQTPPGAPLFVYPAAPLLNFLAERPNPTHFDHFFPGTLNPSDFDTTIAELQAARPRYVIWDHRGVVVWGTEPANRPLSDYLWTCYSQVAAQPLPGPRTKDRHVLGAGPGLRRLTHSLQRHVGHAESHGQQRDTDRRLLGAAAAALADVLGERPRAGQQVTEGQKVHLLLC
jgi:hypothetical protein